MKKFSTKITVLISYSVHDKVGEIWVFIKEFPIAAMLNSSQENHFAYEFSRFSRITFFPLKIKNVQKIKKTH